jgi:hypothetical protein
VEGAGADVVDELAAFDPEEESEPDEPESEELDESDPALEPLPSVPEAGALDDAAADDPERLSVL